MKLIFVPHNYRPSLSDNVFAFGPIGAPRFYVYRLVKKPPIELTIIADNDIDYKAIKAMVANPPCSILYTRLGSSMAIIAKEVLMNCKRPLEVEFIAGTLFANRYDMEIPKHAV